jgi:DNA gyrase subunit A
MLVTDGGQLIRMPVHDIRIAGRNTQGVTLFKTAKDESVVSVARLGEGDDANGAEDEDVDGDTATDNDAATDAADED